MEDDEITNFFRTDPLEISRQFTRKKNKQKEASEENVICE